MVSSFHCIGMCGPLALALPVQRLSRSGQAFAIAAYHLGRVSTYAFLGLICGLLGRRIYIAGFQQAWSITLGTLLLIAVSGYGLSRSKGNGAMIGKLYQGLQGFIARQWSSPSKSSFILLGMANGLLPCGMVYLAIAGALGMSVVKDGVIFMVFFGVGTLPMMLGLSYFRRLISFSFRHRVRSSIPFLIAGMGILLILRGLNLGIPFISPVLAGNPGQIISCH